MKKQDSMRSLSRAIAIIQSFSPDNLEMTSTEIAHKLKIPISTTYRILERITDSGLIERDAKTSKYRIGPALYSRGILYISTTDIIKASEPVTKVMNELTDEAVLVGILENSYVILVWKEEARDTFRISEHIGSVIPAHVSAMGKALLSELSETELDTLYPEESLLLRTRETISTKTSLESELEEIRKTRISFDKGEDIEGISGVGSVIRNNKGKAIAAISISVPKFRMNETKYECLAKLVKMGASLISYRLGYQARTNSVRNAQEILSWWKQNQVDS